MSSPVGQSIKLPWYGIELAGEEVFATADPRKINGIVFGILVASGSPVVEAHRNVVTMGLSAVRNRQTWTIQTKDGRELRVLAPVEKGDAHGRQAE